MERPSILSLVSGSIPNAVRRSRPLLHAALLCVALPVGAGGLLGCNLAREAHAAEAAPEAPAEAPAAKPEHAEEKPKKFGVPFVPEDEADLRNAHGFLRTLTRDNERFVKSAGPKHFLPFVDKQKPRATVVTCSDSRVQSTAFDAEPENDVFTIRNIGNQIATSDGSVQYGIEHLKTPVLFIMGHTGCGAVKAAMGDTSKLHASIRKEIDTLHVEKAENPEDNKLWLEAVIANVSDQVHAALGRYPEEIAQGKLIVVGGVYDLRNDLKDGNGKVHIVNVNGQTDAKKLKSFAKAIAREMPSFDDAEGADKDGKGAKEEKDLRDAKDSREGREGKDAKEGAEARGSKEVLEMKEGRGGGSKEGRKDSRETLRDALGEAPKGLSESREKKDAKEPRREESAAAAHKESKH